mmetsp:Transcript_5325/g.13263  ORF Transcript_5325/g.13263 Transcript_5325/m.13263 type:complete len:428 (+) Transcript_5325:338-1621(+)
MWHLDYARIVCVSCVVTEHSGGSNYTAHNVVFVLQWVLPYLYLTSGMCFMLSSAPLWFYVFRLAAVLAFGVLMNLLADMINGRDWQDDPGNTVFQMFYVVFLIWLAVSTAPLRRALRWRRENPTAPCDWKIAIVAAFWGAVSGLGFVFLVTNTSMLRPGHASTHDWTVMAKPVLENAPCVLATTGGVAFLCSLACALNTSDRLGWLLLVVIYVPRVFVPYDSVGYPHNVELYFFGMVAEKWRLRNQEVVAARIRAYWPIFLAVLMLLGMPNMTGRCDLYPPDTCWERFRFYLIELALVIAFVSGAFNTSDPLKVTRWMNHWALFAYCTHVALARLLPAPLGPILTYSSSVFFFAWDVRRRHLAMATGTDLEADANGVEDTETPERSVHRDQCTEGVSLEPLASRTSAPSADTHPNDASFSFESSCGG